MAGVIREYQVHLRLKPGHPYDNGDILVHVWAQSVAEATTAAQEKWKIEASDERELDVVQVVQVLR